MEQRIEVSTVIRSSLDHVREVLSDDIGCVVAGHATAEDRHDRRFTTSLSVEVRPGATISQDVAVEVRPPHLADPVSLPLHWSATQSEHLFPIFEGELLVRGGAQGSELSLVGAYRIPLGPVGKFGDKVLGRRLARQSLSQYLNDIAARLDHEVDRRTRAVAVAPTAYQVDFREYIHPHGA